jgi:hypothetical protein
MFGILSPKVKVTLDVSASNAKNDINFSVYNWGYREAY